MFLNVVFVFYYTVIRARVVRTIASLEKKLNVEESLFLSHGETISS